MGVFIVVCLLNLCNRPYYTDMNISDSNVARRLLSTLRIGVLRGGCEIEVLKTEQHN
jgi:hypothetical protein